MGAQKKQMYSARARHIYYRDIPERMTTPIPVVRMTVVAAVPRFRSGQKMSSRRASLKSAKKKAVSLARTLRARSLKEGSSVESLILEKLPSKDLEGDFQVSIWAHG